MLCFNVAKNQSNTSTKNGIMVTPKTPNAFLKHNCAIAFSKTHLLDRHDPNKVQPGSRTEQI